MRRGRLRDSVEVEMIVQFLERADGRKNSLVTCEAVHCTPRLCYTVDPRLVCQRRQAEVVRACKVERCGLYRSEKVEDADARRYEKRNT